MREVVAVSGARTAVGAFGGSLKIVPVVELGVTVMNATLKNAGLRPQSIDALMTTGPDALKSQGLIELEKKAMDWDDTFSLITMCTGGGMGMAMIIER